MSALYDHIIYADKLDVHLYEELNADKERGILEVMGLLFSRIFNLFHPS